MLSSQSSATDSASFSPYLLVMGGYSANCEPSDIVMAPLKESLQSEGGSDDSVHTHEPVRVICSSQIVARDGGVLHALPSSQFAVGFAGVDCDSYDQVNTCFLLGLENASDSHLNVNVCEVIFDTEAPQPSPRCRPASSLVQLGNSPSLLRVKVRREPSSLASESFEDASTQFVTLPSDWCLYVFGGEGTNDAEKVLHDLWMLRIVRCVDENAKATDHGASLPLGKFQWTHIDCGSCASPAPRYLAAMPTNVRVADLFSLSPAAFIFTVLMYGGARYGEEGAVISNGEVWALHATLPAEGTADHHVWERLFPRSSHLSALPLCNGHIGAQSGDSTALFFGGKDFATGNDAIHLVSTSSPPNGILDYKCIPCPYADDPSAYINEDADVGGTGKGVWPHWRYTPTIDVVDSGGTRFLLLTCGDCRHNDDGSPVYFMRL